jgi:DNA-binding GntR family transcriptional regulator
MNISTTTDSPRESIAQAILQEILEGKILAGTRLITDTLAKRFSVSHTPVREALLTLSGTGFVEFLPHRGAVVKEFRPREIREIWDVRLALELLAIRSACGRVDRPTLHVLKTKFTRLATIQDKATARDLRDASKLDTQLHALIRDSSGNQFLINELARIHSIVVVIRDAAWKQLVSENNLVRLVEESKQHLAIVDALLSDDRTRSLHAMRIHLRTGKQTIIKAAE